MEFFDFLDMDLGQTFDDVSSGAFNFLNDAGGYLAKGAGALINGAGNVTDELISFAKDNPQVMAGVVLGAAQGVSNYQSQKQNEKFQKQLLQQKYEHERDLNEQQNDYQNERFWAKPATGTGQGLLQNAGWVDATPMLSRNRDKRYGQG